LLYGLGIRRFKNLKQEHIIKNNANEMWIRKSREKTNNICNIPLLNIPKIILEKYKNNKDYQAKEQLLPVPTNLELGMEALSSSASQDRYLNNNQACEMLHISQRTLQDYKDKGRISFYKLEGKILYKYSDIENLLNNNYKAWE